MPPKKWEVTQKKAGGRSKQVAILSFLNSLWKGQICLKMLHILVVSQHQLRAEMSKTQKKIYVASSNATSSSRLCKSVHGRKIFSHCKTLFGKANRALLLATEAIYGNSLQRRNYF